MAKSNTVAKEKVIKKSRIHFREFRTKHTELSDPVIQAGFIAYLKGIEWMYPVEWDEIYKEYKNRKI